MGNLQCPNVNHFPQTNIVRRRVWEMRIPVFSCVYLFYYTCHYVPSRPEVPSRPDVPSRPQAPFIMSQIRGHLGV